MISLASGWLGRVFTNSDALSQRHLTPRRGPMKKTENFLLGIAIIAAASSGLSRGTTRSGFQSPDIAHDRLACMSSEEFPFVEARLRGNFSSDDVEHARVYFRAHADDWHYVSMRAAGPSIYQAALPRPLSATATVHYYVEFTFTALEPAKTEIYTADVPNDCRGSRLAPPDLTRDIVVGAIEDTDGPSLDGFSMVGVAVSPGFFTTRNVVLLSAASAGVSIGVLSKSGDTGPPAADLTLNGQRGGTHSCQQGMFFDILVSNPTEQTLNVTSWSIDFTTSSAPRCHPLSFMRPVNHTVPARSASQTIVFPRPANFSGPLCLNDQNPGCDWAARAIVMTDSGILEDAITFSSVP